LPLEVGEIGVGDIEPLRQHPRDQNGQPPAAGAENEAASLIS